MEEEEEEVAVFAEGDDEEAPLTFVGGQSESCFFGTK